MIMTFQDLAVSDTFVFFDPTGASIGTLWKKVTPRKYRGVVGYPSERVFEVGTTRVKVVRMSRSEFENRYE